MAYYSYHNRLKQLLSTKEYTVIPGTGEFAFRFYFPEINKSMPIREHRVNEYAEYLQEEKK